MKTLHAIAACVLLCGIAAAQKPCTGGRLSGTVEDSTGAIIPGASVQLDSGETVESGDAGQFRFACASAGQHHLHIRAASFASREMVVRVPQPKAGIIVTLQPQDVATSVDVGEDTAPGAATAASGASQTISGDQLSTLADDPDDLRREIQQLAATSGGLAANTMITVDGFQSASPLPPKSSIAYIKVNPDLFSAEYRQPPFDGGRVEVYTRPGQSHYHGALFATNGSPWMNARDPFSTNRAALGKQRYGFELSGPVRQKGSDFALTLEHRTIDNFAVVNAITLDSQGNRQSVIGLFPRNAGRLPWAINMDMNIQREFHLTKNPKADHPQALTLNVRSSNVLNHLNVTSVGSVLGSPLFNRAYKSDNGRRIEFGARYSF